MQNKFFLKPLRTEKTMREIAKNKYAFEVDAAATKTDIKKIAQEVFGIKVVSMQTIKVHGKKYKTWKKGLYGRHSDWKKAIIEIQAGQKIDLFEAAPIK